ncbi:MAG: hypothetical protein ACI8U4_000598 [Natronomonas sp.]
MIRVDGRWLLAAAVLGLVVVGAVVAADAGTSHTLVVEDYETGEELFTVPVENNTTVTLAYTHSVEKTPVRDIYAVRDGELVMTRMEYHSFGAGLPSTVEVERADDGSYVYRPPNRRTDTLVVATGYVADHELVVDGKRYALAERADGGSVRIYVRNRFDL